MRALFGWLVGVAATLLAIVAVWLFLGSLFTLNFGNLVFSVIYMMISGGMATLSAWVLKD
jgi:hypothetical protein